MAAAAILDFQVKWIWLFRRVDSVVFVLCTKFGSNTCYSHWDIRIYASDIHLMTSCELTSGFEFSSRGHLRMAVMHFPIKFGANNLFQHLSYRPSCDDVTRINFRFRLLDTWSPPHSRDASYHKFGANICIQSRIIDIFPKLKMAAAVILDSLGSHGTTHESPFVVRIPCKNFLVID